MKRIKMNLALLAVIIGTGAAFATAKPKPAVSGYYYDQATQTWLINTRSQGNGSGQYKCLSDPNEPCTATGLDSQGNPIGVVNGDYHVNP